MPLILPLVSCVFILDATIGHIFLVLANGVDPAIHSLDMDSFLNVSEYLHHLRQLTWN